MNNIQNVSLDLIRANPFQPRLREDGEHVLAIAESIERDGLLQVPSGRISTGSMSGSPPAPDTLKGTGASPHMAAAHLGGGEAEFVELAFGMTRLAAFRLLAAENPEDERWSAMPVNIVAFDDRQMFEAAVTENIRRKDLNHVERAQAMRRYMDEFGSTSAQVGELFGVNESTVRGALRLLELPENALDGLQEGSISLGTARELLTLQKLAPKLMDETVDVLREGWVPSQDSKKLIDARINKGALEMWESWRDGEPRAGKGLWLLDHVFADAFEFPTLKEFEEAYSGADLLVPEPSPPAPEGASPQISADAEYLGGEDTPGAKPADVYDLVRETFEEQDPGQLPGITFGAGAFAYLRPNVPESWDAVISTIEHLVIPPACSSCPFHAVVDKAHFCGVKVCHMRKRVRWADAEVKAYAEGCGVPIYDAERDGMIFDWLEQGWGSDKQVFEEEKESLRLRIKFMKGWDDHPFTGSKEFGFVVVGEVAEARREAAKQRKAEEKARKEAEKEARANEDPFRWEKRRAGYAIYRPVFASVLWDLASETYRDVLGEGLVLGVLDSLTDKYYLDVELDEESLEDQSRYLVYGLVLDAANLNIGEDTDDPLGWLDEKVRNLFEKWGKKLPENWGVRIETERELASEQLAVVYAEIEGGDDEDGVA